MKHIVYKVVAIVSILSLLLGLFGCGGNKKYTIDDIVLVHTGYYGMESNPVYSFAMRKEEDNWVLTEQGWLVSNQIILALNEAQEKSTPLAKKR